MAKAKTAPRMSTAVRDPADNVIVEIGPDRKKYVLHGAFLKYHSEYSRKALKGQWKEAQDKVITLDDVEPGVFNVFVDWLYTRKLPSTDAEWMEKLELEQHDWQAIAVAHMKAYGFGDRFQAPAFRRVVNNSCVKYYMKPQRSPNWGYDHTYDIFDIACDNIPCDRPMLQMLADICCSEWNEHDDYEAPIGKLEVLPQDFMIRVIRRYSQLRFDPDTAKEKRCYLEHASDEEKDECNSKHMTYEPKGIGYFRS